MSVTLLAAGIDPRSRLEKRVKYRRDHVNRGFGVLVVADKARNVAVVVDEIDGQLWFGNLEHIEVPDCAEVE